MKKGLILFGMISIFLILFLPVIMSGTAVVEVNPTTPTQSKNYLTDSLNIFKSKLVWTIIIVLVIAILILAVVFFFVKWAIQFIKNRSDVFWQLKNQRIKLASVHRRYNSTHWLKTHKNIPIRLVRKDGDTLIISNPIAHHRGDYVTHEGNTIISLNLVGNKKWLFFPITDLLIIPNKDNINVKESKIKSVNLENMPLAKDIVRYNEGEILIFAESLSNTGIFYIPVVKTTEGGVMDLSLPIFASLKQVVLGDYLFEQTAEFSRLAKKSMDINPNLRYATKLGDSSANVDVPTETK